MEKFEEIKCIPWTNKTGEIYRYAYWIKYAAEYVTVTVVNSASDLTHSMYFLPNTCDNLWFTPVWKDGLKVLGGNIALD